MISKCMALFELLLGAVVVHLINTMNMNISLQYLLLYVLSHTQPAGCKRKGNYYYCTSKHTPTSKLGERHEPNNTL